MAAPGEKEKERRERERERGVENVFFSSSFLSLSLFPSSSLTSKAQKMRNKKRKNIQLNIQLLEAGLSVDTLQEG